MKWYVWRYNFNAKIIEKWNIFENSTFNSFIEKALKEFVTYDDFKEKVRKELSYYYRTRAEHEILVSSIFNDDETKIDIYDQVVPNLDILCHYIIDYWNNMKGRRKKINESIQ